MESLHVDCACTNFKHTFRFTFDPLDGDLWLEVQLHRWQPWYKRVWMAFKYVFSLKPTPYGHYDVTQIDLGDASRIRDLMDRAVEAHNRQELDDWSREHDQYLQQMANCALKEVQDNVSDAEGGA